MAINVGINGFGRIGRIIFRTCLSNNGLKVSAINDPAVDIEYICYLVKFDSTHGKFKGTVEQNENEIIVDGNKIAIYREKLPTNIPWQLADVQYVVEASGMFTNLEKASGHLTSDGVKRVIVTAPSVDVPMAILGVNDDKINSGHKVISSASSTLYCLAPIIKILDDNFGVSEGFITSIHAMTPSLKPLDGLCLKGRHWRDHRSIHQNIIPATTGACRALGKIIPQVKDKMSGLAFRVPIVNVSVLDITIRLKTSTSMAHIIDSVENAGKGKMKNIIKISDEEAVSSDFVGDTYSCILDLNSSLQLSPNFFKLICWYENEFSYACRVVDSIFILEKQYQSEWKAKMAYMRPTPKQSLVSQSDHYKKQINQNNNNDTNIDPKILCSTSQSTGLKTQSPKQPLKKPVSSRNIGARQVPYSSQKQKKKNEIFKIWNDGDEIIRGPLRQNRSSFFNSCVAISPLCNNENIYVKTQERLNNVKREFSRMVTMTENLLEKSHHDKIQVGTLKDSLNDAVGDSNKNISKNFTINDDICKKNELSPNNRRNLNFIHNIDTPTNINCKTLNNPIPNEHDESITKTLVYKDFKSDVTLEHVNNYPLQPVKDTETILKCVKEGNAEIQELNKNVVKITNQSQIENGFSVDESDKSSLNFQLSTELIQHNNVKKGSKKDSSVSPVQAGTNQEEDMMISNFDEVMKDESDNNSVICVKDDGIVKHVDNAKVMNDTIVLHKTKCEINTKNIPETENGISLQEGACKGRNLQKRLEGILKKLTIDSKIDSEKHSTCLSSEHTMSTLSNRGVKHKQDIYDKLDSVSATDSENSFHMYERKSQVINIGDLTNSLDDLERLDKICRIIEISDELSDKLLSALNNNKSNHLKSSKWSFKDMCERINLDDFCNKIF